MSDVIEVLKRLRRKTARERTHLRKLSETYRASNNAMGLERAFGEANVLSIVIHDIDAEIERAARVASRRGKT